MNGRVLDSNRNEIKRVYEENEILGAREIFVSLYDYALNEWSIKWIRDFKVEIEKLID